MWKQSLLLLPPQVQLLPPPDDTVATDAGGGARRPSLGATPYQYSPVEVARNGGIPIFIQERIEERQKRRSDVESSERLTDDVWGRGGSGVSRGGGRRGGSEVWGEEGEARCGSMSAKGGMGYVYMKPG